MQLLLLLCAVASASAGLVSVDEFKKCAGAFGHGQPPDSVANAFINQATSAGGITTKKEALIAIAQMAHESAGFTAKSEWACSNGKWSAWPCDSYDKNGCPPDKKYFGRGFIQLTHCYNYKAAAADLHKPEIVNNPDLVATDDNLAMATALWFWKKHVHQGAAGGSFGAATNAINGGLECRGGKQNIAKERWNKYNECVRNAGAQKELGTEKGCYN